MNQSLTYQYPEFPVQRIFHFSVGIQTDIGKIWYPEKISEPVSVKFGIGKKFRTRYRKNLIPKKSTDIKNIWCRKKVSVSVSFKILGIVTLCKMNGIQTPRARNWCQVKKEKTGWEPLDFLAQNYIISKPTSAMFIIIMTRLWGWKSISVHQQWRKQLREFIRIH